MTERAYKDKDMVTVTRETSPYYGHVGIVEIRLGWDTDIFWTGGTGVCQKPTDMRRLKPGDRIVNP